MPPDQGKLSERFVSTCLQSIPSTPGTARPLPILRQIGNTNDSGASVIEPDNAIDATNSLRPGSSHYYALLGLPPATRRSVVNWLNLCRVIATSLHEVSDPEVAQKKIHWWHEEIERLVDGAPRHPQSIALHSTIEAGQLNAQMCLSILEANSAERFNNAEDSAAYDDRLVTDYGTRIRTSLAITGDKIADSTLHLWAIGLGNIDRLIRFRHLYQQGYPVFPDASYAAHQLKPEQLSEPEYQQQAIALFHEQRTRTQQHLTDALQAGDTKTTVPLQRIGRLRIAQLRLWEDNTTNHYRSYATLTPMRKAWIALFKRRPD